MSVLAALSISAVPLLASAQPAGDPPPDPKPDAPKVEADAPKPDAPKPDAPQAPKADAPQADAPKPEPPKPEPPPEKPPPATGFAFGSYGRMIAATDLRGRPGRDADIAIRGSRLDEGNYVEMELRRDDWFSKTKTATRLVATLAAASPVFHYNGDFDAKIAVRNFYIEGRNIGGSDLSVWAGSRLYRGDDIYLLDWWPLDGLNTLGGGARYDFTPDTFLALHAGMNQPGSAYFLQAVNRAQPLNQFGSKSVNILDRQKMIGTVKASHIIRVGKTGGIKGVLYSELHALPQGQRETAQAGTFETLPGDVGFTAGAQIGAFTGERSTHVNLFFRYSGGLAAYGEFGTPTQLDADKKTTGAREVVLALGANWEKGPFTLLLGAYLRSFRNASPDLDYGDSDEGVVALRPHIFFGELGGLAIEGSFQAQQRGVIPTADSTAGSAAPSGPLAGRLLRFGVIPFLSPAGRGSYSRPQFRLIYLVTSRNEGAKSLYAKDDVYAVRSIEHFLGFGAEWWFSSSTYNR